MTVHKTKRLRQVNYESLCAKACSTVKHAAPNETTEDAYWWSICREVYRYLNVPFDYSDVEEGSRGHVYRAKLELLIHDRQTTPFDPVTIGNKYIYAVIKKTCELHGTLMKPDTVPLAYGLPPKDEELWEARATLFPNANSYRLGGCIVGSSGYSTETLACQQCRDAERAWIRTHPRPY